MNYITQRKNFKHFIAQKKRQSLLREYTGYIWQAKDWPVLEIMDITGAARRTIQQWVHRYNKQGIVGLKDKPRPGTPTKLPREKEFKLKKRIEAGPTKFDGVSVLNGPAIRRILEDEFGVLYSIQGLYDLLHRLGYSCLCPRPQHEKADPQLQEEFKKTSQRRWIKSNQSIQAKK